MVIERAREYVVYTHDAPQPSTAPDTGFSGVAVGQPGPRSTAGTGGVGFGDVR